VSVNGGGSPPDEPAAAPIPIHPLFVSSKNTDPLPCPIGAIDVHRRTPAGKMPMLRWLPADALADEMELLEQFGPGEYMLVGRDEARTTILRRAFVDVGEVPEAPPPAAATKAAPSAMDFVTAMLEREREDRRAEREREREERKSEREREQIRSRETLQLVTGFANSQLESQREFTKALAASKGSAGNTSAMKDFLDFHESMSAQQQAQRDVLTEEIKGTLEAKGSDIVETFAAGIAEGIANKVTGQ
jgi:hypothetical protein